MSEPVTQTTASPILSRRVYDIIKLLAQLLLPALGAAYFSLAEIWGLPKADEVVGTIVVVDTFLGVLLTIDKRLYEASGEGIDGHYIVDREDGIPVHMRSELKPTEHPEKLAEQDKIVFKVVEGNDVSV